MDQNKFNLNTLDKNELHNIAIAYSREGDDNNAIKFLLKAIEQGNPYSCIEMCLCIKYARDGYEYTEESLAARQPDKFSYYLDSGIAMGSLDCKFFKAREQIIGDGYIEFDLADALKTLLELKEADYDPWDYFEDDFSVDDYIEMVQKALR